MADNSFGVYVSIRNTDGGLWSSNRSEQAEVEADLEAAFGAEFREAFIASLKGVMVKSAPASPRPGFSPAPVAAPAPVTEPVVQTDEPIDEAAALAAAEAMLVSGPEPVVEVAEPTQQFESCEVCGSPKDQWRPPGVSKAGKKYPGFFGCGNFKNHPR